MQDDRSSSHRWCGLQVTLQRYAAGPSNTPGISKYKSEIIQNVVATRSSFSCLRVKRVRGPASGSRDRKWKKKGARVMMQLAEDLRRHSSRESGQPPACSYEPPPPSQNTSPDLFLPPTPGETTPHLHTGGNTTTIITTTTTTTSTSTSTTTTTTTTTTTSIHTNTSAPSTSASTNTSTSTTTTIATHHRHRRRATAAAATTAASITTTTVVPRAPYSGHPRRDGRTQLAPSGQELRPWSCLDFNEVLEFGISFMECGRACVDWP